MTERIATPDLEEIIGKTDSESIQNAINFASEMGVNSVMIPRINRRTGELIWSIDRAIIFPSDMELVLDNCHLRLSDVCFDNMFRNFGDTEREGHQLCELW